MVELSEDNKAIDVITITDTLESSGHLEDIGGASYLSEISSVTPTAANVSYYAKIVEERSLLRKLITTANDIAQSGYEDNGDVLDVLNNAEQKILEVSEDRKSTRLNSSHVSISYAVFCLKKKTLGNNTPQNKR